ncbi:NAD(P)/FAD-dependent oxidoreductase [Solirubrobacter sp. CPCC 204708]|uniref:NAD(P)/FAD-dependent oxidoreductase n=1 Tax=Solirubrobacter deserti TaxID=2282478 RepID=A0ABT4RVE4_9ACTN|nr:NAD(P)/FAD-dependent oxidoreductase [Solirubrobacter deserti]MBE2320178.1 NAD(P)/FAD-dependent oxidoreductase [Solirubrobacter deserti]MDA0142225.1 NAD(P)/FAD-dependent oxidoreductase [Solirubrobacter deserti]
MDVDIAIVGSGFSGLGLGVRLRQEGIEDFVVLERGDGVGGTWHYNTYPGCACDVPSHLYSFSFAPNPDWTRTYSRQPEIRAYLERVAERVRDRIRLKCEVRDARWDGARWNLQTSDGPVRARVLVAGTGPLVEPRFPDFPGLERFQGVKMHSARWDHSVDLRGTRVASIGTGASAIQYVPRIAPEVDQLYVVQRTPPWVMPHSARPISRLERRVFRRFPLAQRALRTGIYATRELLVLGMVKYPPGMKLLERAGRRHMERALKDPELIAKATPDYTAGCKRILPSNDWYPALARENVELVTKGVAEVRERSIVLTDGRELEVDALVFGTGFQVLDMPVGRLVRGRDGRTLAEVWNGSPRAHLGVTVPGFPNFFMMMGPNTGLGHTSVVYMIEAQIAYVLDALHTGAHTVEVRPEVVERFHAEVQRRMRGTVWSTGCKSWYQDEQGNNPTLWPDWTWRYRQRTARFKDEEYVVT